jgi:hypothetical protein
VTTDGSAILGDASMSKSARKRPQRHRLVYALVGLLWLFGGVSLGVGFDGLRQMDESGVDWGTVEGLVVFSEVESLEGSVGPLTVPAPGESEAVEYRPNVIFRFRVDDAPYYSDRIWFLELAYDEQADAQTIADNYPAGKRIKVFFDRNFPQNAVLERRLEGVNKWKAYLGFGLGAWLLLTAFLLASGFFRGLRERIKRRETG